MEEVDAAIRLQALLVERITSSQIGIDLASAFNIGLEEIKYIHIAEAIAHHFRNDFALKSSPFSLFVEGQNVLSPLEIQGGLVFYGKGRCGTCHTGPHFSDFQYHNIIVPQAGFGKNGFGIDYGRFNVTHMPGDLYKFRTPPLANVTRTGPYSHSGSLVELSDVIIAHFDPLRLFDTMNLDPIRRRELFARIRSLESDPIPAFLTDEDVEALVSFLGTLSFN